MFVFCLGLTCEREKTDNLREAQGSDVRATKSVKLRKGLFEEEDKYISNANQ